MTRSTPTHPPATKFGNARLCIGDCDVAQRHFDRLTGHEQTGHRPVLSPARYNAQRGMMICCPMTSRSKGYAFEVVVSTDPPSVILSDQVKSLDWRARRAMRKGSVNAAVLADVRAKLTTLLQF